jgi:bacillithiol biosynthesis cysteine-adding enzyme BshC
VKNIATDYLRSPENVLRFFASSPSSLFSHPARSEPWDSHLTESLRRYQNEIGNTATFQGTEPVIVTGQQPGLLTGPLYTIYKAVTAIKLADSLSRRHGTQYIPVFWDGSDDHDFEEASEAYILTKNHESMKLRYEPAADVASVPLFRVPLEPSLKDLIDRAADSAAGSEYRNEIQEFLHESLDASRSFAEWTCRILARLFRDTPLVVFSPHLPAARALAIPVLETCIAQPLQDTRLLNETGARLAALGYEIQVVKDEASCNFFLDVNGKRRKVLHEDGAFIVPEEALRYSQDDLRALVRAAPERFSPNVALRCIMQQRLFPTAAYVAGPGEIAYWAQLKPVFDHFGETMPVVYPRARAVITDIKLNKLSRKLQLTVEDLYGDPESLLERSLAAGSAGEIVERFKMHRAEIERTVENLDREMNVGGITSQLRDRIQKELDRFERSLLRVDEAELQTTTQQIRRLCTSLAPARRPQERYYNVFSFLFKQGWGLVERLVQDLDIESFEVNEVEL